MSESWSFEHQRGNEYCLRNPSRTLVRVNRRADVDLSWFFSVLEDIGLPIAFTRELEEINFTWIKKQGGDYLDGKIRVTPITDQALMAKIFVHELGHHVDEQEALFERDSLIEEKKDRGHLMDDKYAQKNMFEYIACGFEVFYCGTPLERKRMKKNNPKLWNVISWIHRKYKNR